MLFVRLISVAEGVEKVLGTQTLVLLTFKSAQLK